MTCRCPECFGLAEFMLELTGKDYGLPRARGHAPQEIPVDEPRHDSKSMTCACPRCAADRAHLQMSRLRRPAPRQPWDVRRAA